MIIIACPGQGSQTPGFLNDWIEDPSDREFIETLSERISIDLVEHGTVSDADTIRDTSIAQPLIVGASLLTWRALNRRTNVDEVGVAGHSVGEFAAATIAGVLSEEEAVSLVAARGRAMAQAATEVATSMSAVIGGDEDEVIAWIESTGLTPANRNGGGQIVAAGLTEHLATLAESAPLGVRVVPLQVAGAFHTSFMESAIPALTSVASSLSPRDPVRPLWTNADGSRVHEGRTFLDLLVTQVSNPVRWDACMESFTSAGITGLIELAPAGALTGLARRGLRGVPTVAVKSPADLDAAVELIETSNA